MRSMAGLDIIAFGIIFIILGVYILLNNNQVESLTNNELAKQESSVIDFEKVSTASESSLQK